MNNQEMLIQYNQLVKEYDDIYRNIAKHFHMSETEFWILYNLYAENNQPTQRELCMRLHTPKQTIHSALRKMEQEGWIQYIALQDHRMKKITLCEKGIRAAQQSVALVTDKEEQAFQCFNETEKRLYLSLLQRHIEHLQINLKNLSLSDTE